MPKVTIKKIVAAIKNVPEKHFRISELAPLLIDEKGKVDIAKCIDQQGELNLAIAEVNQYIKATQAAEKVLFGIDGERLKNRDEEIAAGLDADGDEDLDETEWADDE